jgi:hypothetical protein
MGLAKPISRLWMSALLGSVALSAGSPTLGAEGAVPRSAYAGPQKLVRLPDGRLMNLICMGEGSPVVVLENGLGTSAWAFVEYKIARMTRTCSYDRERPQVVIDAVDEVIAEARERHANAGR